ncbi:MAG: DUF4097 family beta strand repeat-containing protein [Hespellia sp.]|nr:DUF4097 family beta strand repeat-containing protein [Hespellia sp.]
MKNKKMRTALLSAVCLVFAGVVLLFIGMFLLGGTPGFYIDGTGIHTSFQRGENQWQIKEKTRTDAFANISVDVDYADIEIIESDDYYIEYQLENRAEPQFRVADKTLSLKNPESQQQGHFSFLDFTFFSTDKELREDVVKIYVPKNADLKNITLYTGTGDITLKDALTAENVSITNDYGEVAIGTLTAKTADLQVEAGDIRIESLTLDSLNVEDDYGNLRVDAYDCSEAEITMSSGDVTFKNADFNTLAVESEYGSVKIGVQKELEQYQLDLATEYGEITLPDGSRIQQDESRVSNSSGTSYPKAEQTVGKFSVSCESGDIRILHAK